MAPAAKKRRVDQLDSISFDPSSREEYLTGFHKRKQQRIQDSRESAAKKDKEQRVRERRQIREQRKTDLERHVAEFQAEMKRQLGEVDETESRSDGDAWSGLEDEGHVAPMESALEDEEYVDEDKYTTVTVEAMGSRSPSPEANDGSRPLGPDSTAASLPPSTTKKRAREKLADDKRKPRKKKFRYETKAERSATRAKQKSKNHKAKLRRVGA